MMIEMVFIMVGVKQFGGANKPIINYQLFRNWIKWKGVSNTVCSDLGSPALQQRKLFTMTEQIQADYHDESSPAPPAVNPNKITIYGHLICPFVRRVMLILDLKSIEYDFIGISLEKKPKWYTQIHPAGKVPFLKHGDKTLWESLVIVNYLDETKGPSIHPSDPYIKARGQLLLDQVFPHVVTPVRVYKTPGMSNEERLTEIKKALSNLEKIIVSESPSKYLQGSTIHYVDYMTWPFLEMAAPFIEILSKDSLDGDQYIASNYPSVGNYIKAMREDASVQKVSPKKEILKEFFRSKLTDFK